jgi:hypothetical protein
MPTAHNAMTASALMLYLIVPRFLLNTEEHMRWHTIDMPEEAIPRDLSARFNQLAAVPAALDLGVVRVLNVVDRIGHALTLPHALYICASFASSSCLTGLLVSMSDNADWLMPSRCAIAV